MKTLHFCRLSLLALTFAASGLFAQTPKLDIPQASPTATLKQRVGITDIEITYSRPSVKGRKIFGGLEPWGEVWRAGANNATKVVFSTPVTLNGTTLPAGTYGLFAQLGEKEWTIIFNKISDQWGAYKYDAKDDVARIAAPTTKLPEPVETFTIDVNDIRDESATLSLCWENTRVPLKLQVEVVKPVVAQIEAAMSAPGDKKPYVDAAMFYLEHNLDLKQAAEWMDAAIAKQPKGYYLYYRKAKILAAMHDNAGATALAQKAISLAKNDPSPAGPEYTRLSETLVASLK